MAPALQCPACGMRHPLSGLQPDTTFRCERCGQKLLVPSASAVAAAKSGAATRPDTSPTRAGTRGPGGPPPRRRVPGAGEADVAATAGVAVTVSANGDGAAAEPTAERRARRESRAAPRRIHWYWRLLAWVVAVPLGFLIAVVPSYELGLISKDDVLDVFVGSGTDRYLRLGLVTLVWAVVTAVLVQLFVELGRAWATRRRRHARGTSRRRGGKPISVESA